MLVLASEPLTTWNFIALLARFGLHARTYDAPEELLNINVQLAEDGTGVGAAFAVGVGAGVGMGVDLGAFVGTGVDFGAVVGAGVGVGVALGAVAAWALIPCFD